MNYQAFEINHIEDFLQIKDEWNELLSRSDCNIPFLRHEWLTVWWKHFGNNNTLAVILIKEKGRLVLALPLMEHKSSWLGLQCVILKSLTNYHSFQYRFLLEVGEEDSISTLYEYLKARPRKWVYLQLEEIRESQIHYEKLLFEADKRGYKAMLWFRGNSAYLPINGSWEDYFESLKAKFRSNLRNRTKRLNNIGEIGYEVIDDSEEIKHSLERGFEIENRSWKGANQSSIAGDPVLVSFYSEIAEVASKEKWLRLSFLKVGEKYAAFDFSLVYNNTTYCLKIGYDPEFSPYSVGQILCRENIKRSFSEKCDEYHFLGETSVQKRDWTSHSRRVQWLYVYNNTILGKAIYAYKFLIKQKLKRRIKWLG